ncbi:hypothetical protein BJ993_000553 [Nocardioides aromaticivorans]|uniref:ABC transporter permease n=1 Tax=Nocardioides aromaticivorans TaxID=200618 RepID=A0A7Y9ZF99_9ACTN|nr:ABC transporter permease [Nocardioides aromaticivorans]NYI43473.1 hypothetical protein [Nocardioides aromaticivorans]
MTATTVETGTGRGAGQAAPARAVPAATPFRRVLHVELRKMFDTRSGLWLMVGVAALSVIATVAVILFAPDDQITYESFATAIGLPLSVILPMIAILGITSEWSQRSGLTTFTLVPSRGRVIGAKAAATLLVGVVSMAVAFAVGALGNLAGSAVAGVDTVWNVSLGAVPQIVLGNLVGMAVGFALGVVLRSSPAAIVGYFVVSFVMPGILVLLAEVREWFADLQPWVDWNTSQVTLFDGATDTAREWAMLGTTSAIWIVLPLVVGGLFVRRSEVK